jgi:NAD(P)-dependent dehydrogenase (short-subunit alcohol dehydrogenase family)
VFRLYWAALTKGGLNAATKSLAIEYAKRGVRVSAVSPGIVITERLKNLCAIEDGSDVE